VSQEITIEGRPDFHNHGFGLTKAKKHPKYVHSKQGMLMHLIADIDLSWWSAQFDHLVRRKKPRMIIRTVCGHTFFVTKGAYKGERKVSEMCNLPKPNAVLCGRCHGTGAIWGKNKKAEITKQEARARLGCVIEGVEA